MREIESTSYNISQNELLVMLLISGATGFYGIKPDDSFSDDRVIIQTLYGMLKKKMLVNNGKLFGVTEEYKKIPEMISSACGYITIYPQNRTYPVNFCYVSERLLIVKRNPTNKAYLRVEMVEKENLADYLYSGGYLPDDIFDYEKGDAWRPYEGEFRDTGSLLNDVNCKLIIESIDSAYKRTGLIYINHEAAAMEVIKQFNGEKTFCEYSRNIFKSCITDLVTKG